MKSDKSRSRSKSRNESKKIKSERKNSKKNLKEKEFIITIIDESNQIEISTIQEFLETSKKRLEKEEISLEDYLEKNDIDDKNIVKYLSNLQQDGEINKFISKYENYQFRINANDRKKFQEYLSKIEQIPLSISKNIIINYSIRDIFIDICSKLLLLEDDNVSIKNIDKIYKTNNVFFERPIDFKIPNKYGTNEIQYYSLLSDIYYYFNQNNSKKKIPIIQRYHIFSILEEYILEMKNINDKELISQFNYLINILYIYLENESINLKELKYIVLSCLPFNEKIANETITILKNKKLNFKFFINGKDIKCFYDNIKDNDIITIVNEYLKIKIEIEAKYINWYLRENFIIILYEDCFMLTVRYPYNCKYNYFTMNSDINNAMKELFAKMIKSIIVKQAMLIYSEESKYKYVFDNDSILNEIEINTHLVYLPFDNYYGYCDKKSFNIYMNISIKQKNNLMETLSQYHLFLISKCHEFKHASLIYMKIYDENNLIKTPEIKFSEFKKHKKYIEINDNSNNILSNFTIDYHKNSNNFEKTMSEYGNLFEYALFGYKLNMIYLKVMTFCLTKNAWNSTSSEFYKNINKRIKDKRIEKIETICKEGILNLIYKYFDFQKRDDYYSNSLLENKTSNFIDRNNCLYIYAPRGSHENIKNLRNQII